MNVPQNQNNSIPYATSFLKQWYILIFYSDINLFLIDFVWCKLCNIWLLLCENKSKGITI